MSPKTSPWSCRCRADSTFRTWLYRITANHVLNMKRHGGELRPQTFASYAAAINDTSDLDLPDPKSVPVDVPLLVEEAKLTCTTGMLMCHDRRQRLVFTLGEILGVGDTVGAGRGTPTGVPVTSDSRVRSSRGWLDGWRTPGRESGAVGRFVPRPLPAAGRNDQEKSGINGLDVHTAS